MAPLPVVNLAIDGTVTADVLRMVDARGIPLQPKVIAYYGAQLKNLLRGRRTIALVTTPPHCDW